MFNTRKFIKITVYLEIPEFRGIPVGTLGIGKPGAINAALFAASILGLKYPEIRAAWEEFRTNQTKKGIANQDCLNNL